MQCRGTGRGFHFHTAPGTDSGDTRQRAHFPGETRRQRSRRAPRRIRRYGNVEVARQRLRQPAGNRSAKTFHHHADADGRGDRERERGQRRPGAAQPGADSAQRKSAAETEQRAEQRRAHARQQQREQRRGQAKPDQQKKQRDVTGQHAAARYCDERGRGEHGNAAGERPLRQLAARAKFRQRAARHELRRRARRLKRGQQRGEQRQYETERESFRQEFRRQLQFAGRRGEIQIANGARHQMQQHARQPRAGEQTGERANQAERERLKHDARKKLRAGRAEHAQAAEQFAPLQHREARGVVNDETADQQREQTHRREVGLERFAQRGARAVARLRHDQPRVRRQQFFNARDFVRIQN